MMIITGIILFPIAFFLASVRLVRDLRAINYGLQEISAGHFGHTITIKGEDELSRIADSMNQLSSEWDHYLTEITRGLSEIANGHFDHRLPEIADHKLGEVALSINQMSSQLKHSIAEERKAEKTKNDLITGVSHDLRTPLTSILGFLEVIEKDRYQDEVEMRYYINIAYEKSLSLRRLIDELFEYTRINNGMPLERSELDLAGLIRQLAEEFVPAAENAGMEIRLNIPEGEFKVQADGGLLVRAYENIIANAIQYGQTGKYIDIHMVQDGDARIVRIQNYGAPIPQQDIPFIFDRFYRVEHSRSKQTGGTGLGLAITKSIIEVHQGHITVRSSKNATVFETCLPNLVLDQEHATVPETTAHTTDQIPSNELFQSVPTSRQRKFSPRKNRLQPTAAAISMMVLLIGAVALFSMKSPLTSALVVKQPVASLNVEDSELMPTRGHNEMVLITGKTDKNYTLLIHEYLFNEKGITIQYSLKHTNRISDTEWLKRSIKPRFQIDPSTKQAVSGINITNTGVTLSRNGTIHYSFAGTPPDKFLLKVNVKSLLLSDNKDHPTTLSGDWSFQLPVERNYRLKANGQSEPLKHFQANNQDS